MAVYLSALLMLGGSARPEAASQPAARIIAISAIVATLIWWPRRARDVSHPALLLLAAITGIIALQLVPLPPFIWWQLGGRDLLVQSVRAAGSPGSWQPISMAPDFTENSLLATLPAWAMLVLFAFVPKRRVRQLLAMIAVGITVAAMLGLVQIATRSPRLYTYAITNFGVATGVFANRNHEGLFLCHLLPLLGAWSVEQRRRAAWSWKLAAASGMAALVAFISLLATGSRAGLLSFALSTIFAMLIGWHCHPGRLRSIWRSIGRGRWPAVAAVLLTTLLIAVFALRSEGVARLQGLRVADDGRVILLRPMMAMIFAYLPMGVGFGAFPTAFLVDEPDANLGLTWLNHAHNDFVEMLIEGGVASAVLIGLFAYWYVRAMLRVRLAEARDGRRRPFAWLGASWIALGAVAALFDYALRTPIMMSMFVLAICLLDAGSKAGAPTRSVDQI